MSDKLIQKRTKIPILVRIVMAYFKVDDNSNIYIKALRKTIKILSLQTTFKPVTSSTSKKHKRKPLHYDAQYIKYVFCKHMQKSIIQNSMEWEWKLLLT
jgi:hypothetical protein